MGCVTICISDELEIAFRRLVRLKYGENRGKYPEALQKQSLIGVSGKESKLLDEDKLFEDER